MLTVVLAVGLDPSMLSVQRSVWESAGYIVASTDSIKETIECFKQGDFDLILLGPHLSIEDKERLTFLIRALSSRTPVLCIADGATSCYDFATATVENDAGKVLAAMEEMMARTERMPVPRHQQVFHTLHGAVLSKNTPSRPTLM
jgi:hypothetical protein